jgi:hypothetical protein
MLHRETRIVCNKSYGTRSAVYGEHAQLYVLNLSVHMVITRPYRVNEARRTYGEAEV